MKIPSAMEISIPERKRTALERAAWPSVPSWITPTERTRIRVGELAR